MKYFNIMFDEIRYWIETDDSHYTMRQTIIEGDKVEISSFQDCLSETEIIEDELEGDIKLTTRAEFNIKWNDVINKYSEVW